MTTPASTPPSPRTDPTSAREVPGAPAIIARAIRKTYGTGESRVHALNGVDLDIRSGEFTAIMGASGSGKSTLLHALAGLDSIDEGLVEIEGTDITQLSDTALTKLRRDRVGFIFQSFNLLPMLSAKQNILLPLDLAGTRVDQPWFDTLVETFGLQERLDHLPSQLSGGQIQRVAITRALITNPSVVFADEPTGNLDSRTTQSVLDFLRLSVNEFGQTIVMVTHERDAAELADRILTMEDGQLVSDERAPFTSATLPIGGAR